MPLEFTDRQHRQFYKLIYDTAGINLEKKKELLKSRLHKRMSALNIDDYEKYYRYVQNDATGAELTDLLTAVSTNFTSFFRENQHFEFLKNIVIPQIFDNKNPYIRGWSAASSSGEELYSILLTVFENVRDIKNYDFKMLGTDISTKMLEQAAAGLYSIEKIENVPDTLLQKYFLKSADSKFVRLKDEIRQYASFKHFNLLSEIYPFSRQFDFIFCRNVIIYFDKVTQQRVIGKIIETLKAGGYLIVGHSESLTGINHNLKYIHPTVYRKE